MSEVRGRTNQRARAPHPWRGDQDPRLFEFVAWGVRRRRWAEATAQNYCSRIRKFLAWCTEEGIRPPRATTAQIRDYLDTVHPTVSTFLHERNALQAWYAWMVDVGKRTDNPADAIARYPVKRSLPRSFDRDTAERIIRTAAGHGLKWELYLAFMFFAGLRRAEACSAEWSMLERDSEGGRWLRLRGKGGYERVVPIHDDLAVLLDRWRAECRDPRWVFPGRYQGEHMSTSCATKWTRVIFDEAGVTEESGHAARHTYATRMIEQGVDVPTVAEALGHLDLSSTSIYCRARPANVAAAVKGLDFKGGTS